MENQHSPDIDMKAWFEGMLSDLKTDLPTLDSELSQLEPQGVEQYLNQRTVHLPEARRGEAERFLSARISTVRFRNESRKLIGAKK